MLGTGFEFKAAETQKLLLREFNGYTAADFAGFAVMAEDVLVLRGNDEVFETELTGEEAGILQCGKAEPVGGVLSVNDVGDGLTLDNTDLRCLIESGEGSLMLWRFRLCGSR
jgi:hypothetical protein